MKITFLPTSSLQSVELSPEDIKALVEQIKSILQMIIEQPAASNALTQFMAAINAVVV